MQIIYLKSLFNGRLYTLDYRTKQCLHSCMVLTNRCRWRAVTLALGMRGLSHYFEKVSHYYEKISHYFKKVSHYFEKITHFFKKVSQYFEKVSQYFKKVSHYF